MDNRHTVGNHKVVWGSAGTLWAKEICRNSLFKSKVRSVSETKVRTFP